MPIDMDRMIDTAVSFFLGGERCACLLSFQPKPRNLVGAEIEVNPYPLHDLGAATAANYAMACEILMKVIILDSEPNQKVTGHDLGVLYHSLGTHTQKNIRANFSNSHFGDEWFIENLTPTYVRPTEDGRKKYWQHLEISRYPYEFDFAVFEVEFLREFFISARQALRLQNPDLLSVFERELGISIG